MICLHHFIGVQNNTIYEAHMASVKVCGFLAALDLSSSVKRQSRENNLALDLEVANKHRPLLTGSQPLVFDTGIASCMEIYCP